MIGVQTGLKIVVDEKIYRTAWKASAVASPTSHLPGASEPSPPIRHGLLCATSHNLKYLHDHIPVPPMLRDLGRNCPLFTPISTYLLHFTMISQSNSPNMHHPWNRASIRQTTTQHLILHQLPPPYQQLRLIYLLLRQTIILVT